MIWLLQGLSRCLVIPMDHNASTFYLGRLGNYTPLQLNLTLNHSIKSSLKCCQERVCPGDSVAAKEASLPFNVSLSPRKFLKERNLSVTCGPQNLLNVLDLMPQNASFCVSASRITILQHSSALPGKQILSQDLINAKSFLKLGSSFYEYSDCELKEQFFGYQIVVALGLVLVTLLATRNKNKGREQLVQQPEMVDSSRSIETNDNQLMPDDHQFFE